MQDKQEVLRTKLIEAAKDNQCRSYGELAPLLGLDMRQEDDRREIGNLLDAINTVEHNAGRPLLSAVVVRTETNMPGPGFFPMAQRLGYEVGKDKQAFWKQEVARVHSYWAEQTPTPIPSETERERIRGEGEGMPLPTPERPITTPPTPQQPPQRERDSAGNLESLYPISEVSVNATRYGTSGRLLLSCNGDGVLSGDPVEVSLTGIEMMPRRGVCTSDRIVIALDREAYDRFVMALKMPLEVLGWNR